MDKGNRELVESLWGAIDRRSWQEASALLAEEVAVFWPATDELFDKKGFIAANENYPGKWKARILRYDDIPAGGVSLVQVDSEDLASRHYVTSYYEFDGGKILKIKEYWSSAAAAPEWRKKYWKN